MSNKLGMYYSLLIKKNLKRLKKEKEWNISQMASYLGVSESYLGHLLSEKSQKIPSIPLLGQICERTNIPITYFFEEK